MMIQESQKRTEMEEGSFRRNCVLDDLFERSTIPIGCIMRRDVVSLDHTKTAYDAAMLMIKKGVGGIVVTAYGKPFGMITERDIVCAAIGLKIPLRDLILSFLASRPLVYASSRQTVGEAADIMKKYNIRRLVIVDGDEIVGMITVRDISILLSPMPESPVYKNYASSNMTQKRVIEELIYFE